MPRTLVLATLLLALSSLAPAAEVRVPVIDGAWWQVAGDPDLGDYTSEKQQPVDFGIWQAADSTWQLWSCIRHTKCGGSTRLFHRWEGRRITDRDWTPKGIAMEADTSLGETRGGLQAPHVIRRGGVYYMLYGDWNRICLAQSEDGKTFRRVLNERGQPDLFSGPYGNSRDPMVLEVGGLFHCYYMGHREDADPQSAIFCRTSHDLRHWSEAMMVSAGGVAAKQDNWYGGDAECPFVHPKDGLYYLFRNQRYGERALNTQYASPNPLAFGVADDRYRVSTLPVAAPEIVRHEGQEYIASLMPSLKGIRIARLAWRPRKTSEGKRAPAPAGARPTAPVTADTPPARSAPSGVGRIEATYSAAEGIGPEKGVMRRDPSDIIEVDGLYHVWYSKGTIGPGYDATVWYATSAEGLEWTEKGMALAKGRAGTWEGASVFTPNILVAEGRYWLFYTGTSREFGPGFNPDSKIGIAVSDSPAGPWERLDSNPALRNSDHAADFDSHLVDDACLIKRRGKYWLYYKGRQLGKSPAQTKMGLAIADEPQGPYVKHESNPVIPGNHEVLVWPQGNGVAALIGTTGPEEWVRSIVYARDGVHFTRTHAVKDVPHAAGAYRPEAFTDSGSGRRIGWGVHIGNRGGFLPFIERFELRAASR